MGNSAGNSWVRLECCLAEKKRIPSGISESFLFGTFFFLNVKCCLISKHIYIYINMIIYSFWFLPNNLSLISSLFGKFLTIPANHGPIFLTLLNIRIPEVISDLYPIIGSASQEELLTENEKLKETLGFLERVRFFFQINVMF